MTDEEQADATFEEQHTQDGTLQLNAGDTEDSSNGYSDHEINVSRDTANNYHTMKWKRLKKHYNDQYLDLFNLTYENAPSEMSSAYADGQVGAVLWSLEEKQLFFNAVDRFGRHDLPKIARAVRTKSQIEVKGYLDHLDRANIDSHLYQRQIHNVSLPDIPAAVEIGEECEQMLSNAADALAAFQEQYDVQAGLMQHGPEWIIDWAVAAKLDAAADKIDCPNEEEDTSQVTLSTDRHQLFRVSKMLSLSEQFFMASSVDTDHNDWQSVAEKGQRPALTQDVMDDLYELIVSQTQRIIQATVVIAKSQSGVHDESEDFFSGDITSEDIRAALDVLKMPHDARSFWTCLPRRSGLQVLSGSHGSKTSRNAPMTYKEVEATLSATELRGRRRFRSESMDRSSSRVAEMDDRPNETSSEADTSDTIDEQSAQEKDSSIDESDQSSDSESDRSSDEPAGNVVGTQPRLSRDKRRKVLEAAQEEYTERLDQRSRRQEEVEIWQLLGKEAESSIKYEEEELGVRPRSLRKTEEELQGWRCTYVSEWESIGKVVPDEDFGATARSKKRKVEASAMQ